MELNSYLIIKKRYIHCPIYIQVNPKIVRIETGRAAIVGNRNLENFHLLLRIFQETYHKQAYYLLTYPEKVLRRSTMRNGHSRKERRFTVVPLQTAQKQK